MGESFAQRVARARSEQEFCDLAREMLSAGANSGDQDENAEILGRETATHFGFLGSNRVVSVLLQDMRIKTVSMALSFVHGFVEEIKIRSLEEAAGLAMLAPPQQLEISGVKEVRDAMRRKVAPLLNIDSETSLIEIKLVLVLAHRFDSCDEDHYQLAQEAARYALKHFSESEAKQCAEYADSLPCALAQNMLVQAYFRERHVVSFEDVMALLGAVYRRHSSADKVIYEVMSALVSRIQKAELDLETLKKLAGYVCDPSGEGHDSQPIEMALVERFRPVATTTLEVIACAGEFGTKPGAHRLLLDFIKRGIPNEEAAYLLAEAVRTEIFFGKEIRNIINMQCEQKGWKFRTSPKPVKNAEIVLTTPGSFEEALKTLLSGI